MTCTHRTLGPGLVALLIASAAGCAAPDATDNDPGGPTGSGTNPAPIGAGNPPAPSGTGGSSAGTGSPAGMGGPVPTSPGTGGTSGATPANTGGGSGSTPAPTPMAGACALVTAPDALLADFESGVARVAEVSGRSGSWFVYNDGTGMQEPVKVPNMPLPAVMPGACSTQYAFRTAGTGFTGFGAGIGTDLTTATAAGARGAYDASAYTGIALRAKAAKAGTQLRVTLSDANTAPEGGVCVDTTDRTNRSRCGDYFGAQITLGTDWQDFVMPFKTMTQRGWGLAVTTGLAAKQVYTFRAVVAGDAAAPVSFELWLDDIRFVK